MAIDDKIKALTKQLYPTGRVWRINPNSIKEKFVNGLLASEIRAYNDGVSILDSTIPDNPNFTEDDASAWEKRLGLPDGTGQSLSDRIKAIIVQLNWPGTNPAKGAIDYLQAILQAAGFSVCTQENLFFSPGGNWALGSITSDPNDFATEVIYGNNVFVLIGNNSGTVYTSSDGATWTSVGSVGVSNISTFAYGAGIYVAAKADGHFYSSTDLVTWTLRGTSGNTSTTLIYRMIFAGGQFVAINRGSYQHFFTSSDGITWTERSIPFAGISWRGIAYNGSVYSVVSDSGPYLVSGDGITWTQGSPPSGSYFCVAFGNGVFVAVGQNSLMTSPDGITWTTHAAPNTNWWYDIVFANDVFVAISVSGSGNRVMTSSDGITWTIGTTPENDLWQSITFGNNIFVAAGGQGAGDKPISVMYSSAGFYYHKTLADFAGTSFTQYKTTLQYGQQNYGKQRIRGVIIANSVDPNGDANFDIGDGSDTIFIGGCPPGTYINIPKSQETAFRQLIIKIKPVNVTVLLLVNFV